MTFRLLFWLLLAAPAARSSRLQLEQVLLDATDGDSTSVCWVVQLDSDVFECKIHDLAYISYVKALSPFGLAEYCDVQYPCEESGRCRKFSTPSNPAWDEVAHTICLPSLGPEVDQDAYDSWNSFCSASYAEAGTGTCHDPKSADLARVKGIPYYANVAPVLSPSPPLEPPSPPATDGGESGPGRCTGSAYSCSSRSAGSCTGGGCSQYCPLRPSAAGGFRTDTCECSGSATSCSTYSDEGSCNGQRGCSWAEAEGPAPSAAEGVAEGKADGEAVAGRAAGSSSVASPPPRRRPGNAAVAPASTAMAVLLALLALML